MIQKHFAQASCKKLASLHTFNLFSRKAISHHKMFSYSLHWRLSGTPNFRFVVTRAFHRYRA